MAWRVYYADGSDFGSPDGEPWQAPRDGVQCVSVSDPTCGRLVWHSVDFYCWQNEWVPRSLLGLMDYLREPGPEKIVLQGRGIAYRDFTEIFHRAVDDPRMPTKTAIDVREPEVPA